MRGSVVVGWAGGDVGGVRDGGAVGARERVFFRLGRARACGSPRACVRLCRCLSTAPAARNAMPLKGVGGTQSPSNISSPSKCSSARWAAPPPRSSPDMVRSLDSPSRLSSPPIGCAHRLARRRRSRSSYLRSRRAKCEAAARSDGFPALLALRPALSSSARKTGSTRTLPITAARRSRPLTVPEPFPLRRGAVVGHMGPIARILVIVLVAMLVYTAPAEVRYPTSIPSPTHPASLALNAPRPMDPKKSKR